MLAGALFSRGYLLGVQGEFSTGLADLRRSQTLFEKLNMPFARGHGAEQPSPSSTTAWATITQAVHIYTRALKSQRDAGMRREVAVTLYNLGRAHENLQEWEFARKAYQESLEIQHAIGYARGEAYALRGLAAVANATGDPRRALDTLKRADILRAQTTDTRLGAHIQLVRGVALHRLGRSQESLDSLHEALQIFREADALGDLSLTYAELARVQAELGNWRVRLRIPASSTSPPRTSC